MHWIAWRMLVGHRTMYLAMLFGVTFAALLIAQRMAIFCGVLRMTTGQICDIEKAPIWPFADSGAALQQTIRS